MLTGLYHPVNETESQKLTKCNKWCRLTVFATRLLTHRSGKLAQWSLQSNVGPERFYARLCVSRGWMTPVTSAKSEIAVLLWLCIWVSLVTRPTVQNVSPASLLRSSYICCRTIESLASLCFLLCQNTSSGSKGRNHNVETVRFVSLQKTLFEVYLYGNDQPKP